MVWYGMVWYGMVWYGMVWYGMVWYGMVWYGMVWYGMVCGLVWCITVGLVDHLWSLVLRLFAIYMCVMPSIRTIQPRTSSKTKPSSWRIVFGSGGIMALRTEPRTPCD